MILTLKTTGDETQLSLWPALDAAKPVQQETWLSERRLSYELLIHIEGLLQRQKQPLSALTGIVVFRGPGSFTSLRIGIATANALAYAYEIPIVGVTGEDWEKEGLGVLEKQKIPQIITPLYGQEPHITKPKK